MVVSRIQVYGYVLISLMVVEIISVMVLVTNSMVYADDGDIYLVDTDDTKVLRVPYLHQDNVNHCWLYSIGMIVTYYGKEFNPDLVLNRVGKGFNVGLYLFEFGKLNEAIKDLYGIELSYSEVRSDDILKNIIISEISNAKPVLLFMKRHIVVVTGYHKNATAFYLVVNDPSGYLTHDIWGANIRFDGSIAYTHNAYGILVDVNTVFSSLGHFESIIVITIKNALAKPNPPKAVVYAYTTPPYASTDVYDSAKKVLLSNYTRFYHNNYLNRSLWYPLPVVALGSPIYINIYVYPNTKHQEELYLDIEATHKDFHGLVTTINDRIMVKVYNLSYAEIVIPSTTRFTYIRSSLPMIRVTIPAWSIGHLQIKLKLCEKDTNNVVYVWGPIDVHVYHELAYLSIDRLLMQVNIIAGILYGVLPNDKHVDLYISLWQPSVLGIPIVNRVLQLTRPCSTILSLPQPDPSLGGYYYVCTVKIPQDKDSIDIVGAISVGLLSIPIKETIVLPSSGVTRFVQFNLREVVLNTNGTAMLSINYCTPRTVFQRYKIAISLNNYRRYYIDLDTVICGIISVKVDGVPTTSPNINISIELLDELGNTVNVKSYTILNPLMILVSDLIIPADVASESHTFIRYNMSIPKSMVQNLYNLFMSASVYANGSEIASSTWVERVVEDVDSYRVLMRSDMYTPPCKNGATECTYILTVVPRIGIKYGAQEDVYIYSYDVRKEHVVKVYSKPIEVKRTALFIVMDVSGSMNDMFRHRTKLDWAKEAAIYLVNMTFDGDYLGIIAFSGSPTVIHDIVEVNKTMRDILIKKIMELRAWGSTNIGDSIKLATDLLNRYELLKYRRIIVLLTDGIHNTGTHPLNVLNYIKDSGVVVYTIGLGEPGDVDENVLNTIAYETGGKYYYAPTPDKLQEIFTHIRGEALALNLIDKDLAKLGPYEELWRVYPMDLSYSDFVIEISWDRGSEPMIILRFLNITVTQGNATSAGIQVSYPAINTLRFTISKQYSYMYRYSAMSLPQVLPINISIMNVNPHNVTIRKNIFGGREALLEVVIDNPTARYLRGQYLYYRIVAEKNKKVQVMLIDSDGNVLHTDTLTTVETTGAHSGTLNHYLKLPENPGEYYLKVSLFDIFLLRTKVIPIKVVDVQYQNPLEVSYIDKVEGFGLIQIPVNITVTDPIVLGKTLTMQVELEPRLPYTPFVAVNPQIIKITNYNQNAYIYINIPYDTIPGEYNLSLILAIEGHSVIVKRNAIKIRIPTINIVVEGIRDVVYAHQGGKADSNIHLRIIGDKKYGIDVGLKPLFSNQVANIEGLPSYETFVYTNSTVNVTVKYNTDSVGVYPGSIEISINGTPINNLRQVLVVLPREANVNKTIWAYGYNTITLGPDNSKNMSIRLKIDWKSHIAGIISVPMNPRSEVDYIVYAYSKEGKAKSLLTIYIPQKLRRQGYVLFIEKDSSIVNSIPITPQDDSLDIVIETGYVYRIWVGTVTTSTPTPTTIPTPTSTLTYTHTPIPTQTQTTIVIGELLGASRSTIPPTTITTTPSRLPLIVTIILVVLAIEIEIILIIYLKKKRGH